MARRALLVGVNDYKGISDLRGCLNDVTNMRNILKTYLGFSNSEIRVLVEQRANKSNILHRLRHMVNNAEAGDTLVFHFSGHGSQIRDRDGDELRDNMDELICPWDMNWDNGFITDDHLGEIFGELPEGVLLEVFLDCCHSGTGLREIGLGRPAELGPENPTLINPTLDRYLAPPIDIESRSEGEEEELTATRGFRSERGSTVKHVLWSGCQENQTSADANINGTFNGAFTYYFCKHVRETGGLITRSSLLKRIRNSLRHNRYSQIPQLEAEAAVRGHLIFTRELESDVDDFCY